MRMKTLFRRVRWWWQRRERGWDDRETWNIDCELARWAAPRLETYRDKAIGYPHRLDADVWFAIVDKMAQAFRFCATYDWELEDGKGRAKYIEEGLDLFREYFFDLWD